MDKTKDKILKSENDELQSLETYYKILKLQPSYKNVTKLIDRPESRKLVHTYNVVNLVLDEDMNIYKKESDIKKTGGGNKKIMVFCMN